MPYQLTSSEEKQRLNDNSKSIYMLTEELSKSRQPVFQDPPGEVRKMSRLWDAHYEGKLLETRGNKKIDLKIRTLLVNIHRGETILSEFQNSEMTKGTIIQFYRTSEFDVDTGDNVENSFDVEDFTGVFSLLVRQINEQLLKAKEKQLMSSLRRDVKSQYPLLDIPTRVLMNYARPIGKSLCTTKTSHYFFSAALELLLVNGKIPVEDINSLVGSICHSVVHTHVAALVPFLSEAVSSIPEEDSYNDLNSNFRIAVTQAISMKSGKEMFSVIAISKDKLYLEKRFAEKISSRCTTKINDIFKALKHTRVHFFDKSDLEHDYFKRVSKATGGQGSNVYGKSTYKYGFVFAWSDVPESWITALISNINRIDTDGLSVHLGCNYAMVVQDYYDKIYLTDQEMESSNEHDKFLTMFDSLSKENKAAVYRFMEECAVRENTGSS